MKSHVISLAVPAEPQTKSRRYRHRLLFCALSVALLSGCASPYGLHQSILQGNTPKALKIVKKGKDIDRPNLAGETPLLLASLKGQTEVATALLDQGAKVDAASNIKRTPLMLAAREGHVDCCRLLLDRGAQPNAADQSGITPVWLGAFNNQLEVVRLLLERGADANGPPGTNYTPLMVACLTKKDQANQLALAKLLVDKGADVKAARMRNCTALHCAAEGGPVSLVNLLVEHGADVNAKTEENRTSLHIAAVFEQKAVLEYLLAAGARPEPNPLAPEATGKLYHFLAEHPATANCPATCSENWRVAAQYYEMAATNYAAKAVAAGKEVTKIFWKNLAMAAIAGAASGLTGAPIVYTTQSSASFSEQKKTFRKKAAECTRWAEECRAKAAMVQSAA